MADYGSFMGPSLQLVGTGFLNFFLHKLSRHFAFSALTLLVGGRKGIWPVKTEW